MFIVQSSDGHHRQPKDTHSSLNGMHRDQNLNRPPVTFYDKIANKAVLMCVNALPVRELKLTLQICRLGWKTRQGSNVSSSQRGQRQ